LRPTRFARSKQARRTRTDVCKSRRRSSATGSLTGSFEYLLQRDGEDWEIINIVADGVSDLALKRAEYQRLFASGGIDGLIAALERQADRLERG
jgi:ABC-type transporter MlaC component